MKYEVLIKDPSIKNLLYKSLFEIDGIDDISKIGKALNLSERIQNDINMFGDLYGKSEKRKFLIYSWITNDPDASIIKLAKAIRNSGISIAK